MKTIIFISDIGSQKRDYDRFGIGILKKKFNVIFLDCTKWLQPNFYRYKAEQDFNFKEKLIIKNFPHLENFFVKKKNKVLGVIDLIGISQTHDKIRNFLKKNNLKLIFILNSELNKNLNLYQKILSYIYKKNKFQAIARRLFHPSKKNYNLNDPDIILLNGENGKKLVRSTQKFIELCHFDYEIYLKEKKKKTNIKKSYALFLDQYLPFHSGQNYIGNISKNLEFMSYYRNLEFFFKKFEEKYNLEIIVAAHPRSDYKTNNLLAKERKFFINQTPELVKNSKIVFTHTSNAINFAVLFKKPIFFLTMLDYRYNDVFRPEFLSNYFKSYCFNIDKKVYFPKKNNLFKFNNYVYEKYKRDFLVTKKFKGTSFWTEFLKKIT